ncbi:hypothetical protein CK203_042965 [Vitis vinifera]|uniref:Isopenicillin N synthase-like Fe(2+) 2OG dioxygenase domain-containing protein n=1 Tax=Vitis vinifera TaxID=29760 RepID=A0A438GZT5_VITVI|nr:hypothetical protein CK203_042965 [Vitis vinifera]
MVGKAFLAWSNGRIHPPKHRVIVKENEVRYIIGVFSFTNGMIDFVRFHGLVSRCHLRAFYYFYSSANVYASFSFGSSDV